MQVFVIKLDVDYFDRQVDEIATVQQMVVTAALELQALTSLLKDRVKLSVTRETSMRDYEISLELPAEPVRTRTPARSTQPEGEN